MAGALESEATGAQSWMYVLLLSRRQDSVGLTASKEAQVLCPFPCGKRWEVQ